MIGLMELGLYTFAELTPDPATGRTVTPEQRLRDLLEEIELADQVGLDVFGVGEHHRPDFAVSAPAVVLAAAASTTAGAETAKSRRWCSPTPKTSSPTWSASSTSSTNSRRRSPARSTVASPKV